MRSPQCNLLMRSRAVKSTIIVSLVGASVGALVLVSICLLIEAWPEGRSTIIRELLGTWVNAAVGALIAWYTWETLKLRKAAETQIDLLRVQSRKSILPFLELELAGPQSPNNQGREYRLTVKNRTDRIAQFVTQFYRVNDSSSSTWFIPPEGAPFDLPDSKADNLRFPRVTPSTDAFARWEELYKLNRARLTKLFEEELPPETGHSSIYGAFFYDGDHNLYLTYANLEPGEIGTRRSPMRTCGPIDLRPLTSRAA